MKREKASPALVVALAEAGHLDRVEAHLQGRIEALERRLKLTTAGELGTITTPHWEVPPGAGYQSTIYGLVSDEIDSVPNVSSASGETLVQVNVVVNDSSMAVSPPPSIAVLTVSVVGIGVATNSQVFLP